MGKQDLTNNEYDQYLASRKHSKSATQELQKRNAARKCKGFEGWHFGLGDKPVHCKDKAEFKKALNDRGLMMRDDVKKELR